MKKTMFDLNNIVLFSFQEEFVRQFKEIVKTTLDLDPPVNIKEFFVSLQGNELTARELYKIVQAEYPQHLELLNTIKLFS